MVRKRAQQLLHCISDELGSEHTKYGVRAAEVPEQFQDWCSCGYHSATNLDFVLTQLCLKGNVRFLLPGGLAAVSLQGRLFLRCMQHDHAYNPSFVPASQKKVHALSYSSSALAMPADAYANPYVLDYSPVSPLLLAKQFRNTVMADKAEEFTSYKRTAKSMQLLLLDVEDEYVWAKDYTAAVQGQHTSLW
jgi:hypothetical protein